MTHWIALYGPPSSGKTTLAKALTVYYHERGQTTSYVSEYAREAIEKYGREPLTNPLFQYKILEKQTSYEASVPNTVEIAVTDSPLPISYVFAVRNNVSKLLAPKGDVTSYILIKDMYKDILDILHHYSTSVLLEPRPIVSDGVRAESYNDAVEIFKQLQGFLDLHCIQYLQLSADMSIEKRVEVVNSYKELRG